MKIKSSKTKKNTGTAKSLNAKKKERNVKTKNENSNDITALILRDHEPIKELILILKDSDVEFSVKRPAFAEFEKILTQHATAEEESLYVNMKKEDDLRVEGLEGDVEHLLAVQLMKEIGQITNDNDLWMAKVKVLAELVDHHVKEEEKEVIKQVRKEFDIETRMEIGKEYLQILSQFQTEGRERKKSTEHSNTRAEHV